MKIIPQIAIPAGLIALAAFVGPEFRAQAKQSDVVIGGLFCLTGQCAEWGTESLRGARLAVSEINAGGGINGRPVRLEIEDSAEDSPVQAVRAFNRLRQERSVRHIIGPTWSPAGLAIAPIAAKDSRVIVTSPSLGVRDFNEAAPNLFNLWPHDENATRALARYAADQGWKRAAIIGVQQPWTETQVRAFKETFTALGGSIVGEVSPLQESRDLRVEVLKIVDSAPDVVLLASFSDQEGIAARELKRLGYRGPKISILVYSSAISVAEGGMEGTVIVSYAKPTEAFRSRFSGEYGAEPRTSADTAYDAVYYYKALMERAGSEEAASMIEAAGKLGEFSGASGVLRFDGKRGVTKEPMLYVVRAGEVVPLEKPGV